MADYSLTLQEVLDCPGFELFEPHPYIDYDHIKELIADHYCNWEINWGTPDLFKRKFNHYLRLNVDNYNKQLKSECYAIDPFITEYLETFDKETLSSESNQHKNESQLMNRHGHTLDLGLITDEEKQIGNATLDKMTMDIGVKVDGKLVSEAQNTDGTQENHSTETGKKETTGTTTKKGTSDAKTDTSEHTDTSSDTDYDETKNTEGNSTVDETYKMSGTNNQLDRDYSEDTVDKGHQLNVAADTPQAMLFNEPNEYMGAGRASESGRVVDGKYVPFPESDPNQIDKNSYTIGGGDTPWYNYGSAATNQNTVDNKTLTGKETYHRTDSQDSTKNTETNMSEDVKTDGEKHESGDKDVTGNSTTHTSTDETDTITNHDDTTNTTTGTIHTHDALAKNTQENTKSDTKNTGKETQTESNNGTKTNLRTDGNLEKTTLDTYGNRNTLDHMNKKEQQHHSAIKKGRTMKSPSELLSDYRATLTFNSDAWLLDRLQPCFLEVF